MLEIHESKGFSRLKLFFELLNILAGCKNFQQLSIKGFVHPPEKNGDLRIDNVYSFTYNNFRRNIKMEVGSDVANLNPTDFCRFFKKHTKMNYSKCLNVISIGYACKLLLEEGLNISEVGYESGFNNLSNFNRQFKSPIGVSSSQYLIKHQRGKK